MNAAEVEAMLDETRLGARASAHRHAQRVRLAEEALAKARTGQRLAAGIWTRSIHRQEKLLADALREEQS